MIYEEREKEACNVLLVMTGSKDDFINSIQNLANHLLAILV